MGRRCSGARWSSSGSRQFDSNISFNIFELPEVGQTPTTFENVVQDFEIGFIQTEGREVFNFGGNNPLSTSISGSGGDQALDLAASFVLEGTQIGFDGQAIPGVVFEDFAAEITSEPVEITSDRIEYRFAGNQLSSAGIQEFTLFIKDDDPNLSGFQVDPSIDVITDGVNTGIDTGLATTSVEYIIENQLLGFIDGFRVVGQSFDGSSTNVFLEDPFEGGEVDTTFEAISPVAEDDSEDTQVNTAVVIDVLANDNVGIIESFDPISTSGGSVVLNGDLLEYTPATGFLGQDTFEYNIIDSLGATATATVTVNVTEIPEPPTTLEPELPEPPTTPEPELPETLLLNGDDVINGDNGDNILLGGEGNNILYGFEGNDFLQTGSGNDILDGNNGNDTLLGGDGNNILYGYDGDDILQTGSGADNLQGDNGNDNLFAGGGNDIITGGDGDDFIDGGSQDDTIDGGSQNDAIFGGTGDDLVNGGNGNDTLNGGAGNDVLVGDGGSDIFVLNALGGNDTIRDFNFGEDRIGLSNNITFDQITIAQGNGAATIHYQGQTIGSISGGTPSQFDASKFVEI